MDRPTWQVLALLGLGFLAGFEIHNVTGIVGAGGAAMEAFDTWRAARALEAMMAEPQYIKVPADPAVVVAAVGLYVDTESFEDDTQFEVSGLYIESYEGVVRVGCLEREREGIEIDQEELQLDTSIGIYFK